MAGWSTVLVCGGRNFADREHLYRSLDLLHKAEPIWVLVEGGAPGADRLAGDWADDREVIHVRHNARWKVNGRAAGPIRNRELRERWPIQLVVAFPGGTGTADMVRRAEAKGVPVMKFDPQGC
ncbi:MAG: DUF2493 domain-containing protein [Candidatus Eisenbacteria bacterium]|nr:DUF2493 domain-containing protein [Candidatus Eisenbacteria bacterium]